MIGATTLDEYRKHVEKDAALERRFQPVLIEAPRLEDTVASCGASRSATRLHHGCVSPTPPWWPAACFRRATSPAATSPTSHRPHRRGGQSPAHRDRLHAGGDRRVGAAPPPARDRAAALRKESDAASRERLRRAWRRLAGSPPRWSASPPTGTSEKKAIRGHPRRQGGDRAGPGGCERLSAPEGDLQRAAELRYGTLPGLERRPSRRPSGTRAAAGSLRMLKGGGREGTSPRW